MNKKQLQNAVKKLLEPLHGCQVTVRRGDGPFEKAVIRDFFVHEESGILNIAVSRPGETAIYNEVCLEDIHVKDSEEPPYSQTLAVKVKDAFDSEARKKTVKVRYNVQGVALSFPGYGDKCTVGDGEPVFIEYREGVPHVVVWADINQEDPTHVISLEDAAVSKYVEEDE